MPYPWTLPGLNRLSCSAGVPWTRPPYDLVGWLGPWQLYKCNCRTNLHVEVRNLAPGWDGGQIWELVLSPEAIKIMTSTAGSRQDAAGSQTTLTWHILPSSADTGKTPAYWTPKGATCLLTGPGYHCMSIAIKCVLDKNVPNANFQCIFPLKTIQTCNHLTDLHFPLAPDLQSLQMGHNHDNIWDELKCMCN